MFVFKTKRKGAKNDNLSAKGVKFINLPTDIPCWGMKVVHLRDPEENLIEFFTPLKME